MQGVECREDGVSFLDTRLFPSFLRAYDICVICGTLLDPEEDRRSHRVETFLYNLQLSWLRTTFTWECIQSLCNTCHGNERLSTCCRCTNWLRRCNRFQSSSESVVSIKKSYLPMDELIAFSLAPGEVATPDTRNLKRLFNVLMEGKRVSLHGNSLIFRNYYLQIIPLHLKQCLISLHSSHGLFQEVNSAEGGDEGGDVRHFVQRIVDSWWEMNNRTMVFRNSKTSILIRKMVKAQGSGQEEGFGQ